MLIYVLYFEQEITS